MVHPRFGTPNCDVPGFSHAHLFHHAPPPAPCLPVVTHVSMQEHDTAIQLNLAPSRQEVKRKNNKKHPVSFQNKTLRVDTSTQISQKRQTQALQLILRSGTLHVVVFNNSDLWVIMWLSRELLWFVSQLSTVLRSGGLKLQPDGGAKRSRNAADTYPVEIGRYSLKPGI